MLLSIQPGILIFYTFSFNLVPAGLCHQISKQVFLVLRPMFQVSCMSVYFEVNFSAYLFFYRSQYRHADIQEIITIVGTIFSQVLM